MKESLLRGTARLLLRCYPPEVREDYGDELIETLLDRHRARDGGASIRFLGRELGSLVGNGIRERLAVRRERAQRSESNRMFYWQDVKYAARLLLKSPLFTLLTVVVLSGGLGVSIFTFSFLHTAMVKPLPLDHGREVVRVMSVEGRATGSFEAAALARIRPRITTLRSFGAYQIREFVLTGDQGGRLVDGVATEWNMFTITRTPAARGRVLQPADQEPGAPSVLVLSDWTWRVVFGRDEGAVGKRIEVNGRPTEIVGVMPPGYGFPVAAEAWMPIQPSLLDPIRAGNDRVDVYARLEDGAAAERVRAELATLLDQDRAANPRPGDPLAQGPFGIAVHSFPRAQMGDEGPLFLAVLNTLAAMILLLACINVTNLLLARANERVRELAVRQALGASRSRLVMQNLWESVILCVLGGALATGVAALGLDGVNQWARANLEGNLAFWWVWQLDRTALLAAAGFVTLAIAVLGGVVAARATRLNLDAVLRDGDARSGGRREGRVARLLVVTQVVTVSILMFFGSVSALIANRITSADLGYDTRNLLNAGIELPVERYPTAARRAGYFGAALDRLAARPEVAEAAFRITVAEIGDPAGFIDLDDGRTDPATGPRAFVRAVMGEPGPLGVSVREGRYVESGDQEGTLPVALVSRALAEREWPGQSPVGRRIRLAGIGEAAVWRTIVGVVSDVPLGDPFSRNRSAVAVYLPLAQSSLDGATAIVRHRGDVGAARAALHRTILELDPLVVPSSVQTLDEMFAKMTLITKAVTRLVAGCFVFALLLAVSGTYGLMARSIGQRTREIGVRRALGASDRTILRLLLGQGGRQLGIGAVLALPVTILIGFAFTRFFPIGFGLTTAIALLVAVAITAVVLLATWLPTRRAIAIEPRDALWRE